MANPGPRVLNFAPLLQLNKYSFNKLVQKLIRICEEQLENPVEIEFAMTFSPPSLGLLQVRSMVVSKDDIQVSEEDLEDQNALAVSENALGNGLIENIKDIVYVFLIDLNWKKPGRWLRNWSRSMEIGRRDSPYLLIVFGTVRQFRSLARYPGQLGADIRIPGDH